MYSDGFGWQVELHGQSSESCVAAFIRNPREDGGAQVGASDAAQHHSDELVLGAYHPHRLLGSRAALYS